MHVPGYRDVCTQGQIEYGIESELAQCFLAVRFSSQQQHHKGSSFFSLVLSGGCCSQFALLPTVGP